MKLAPPVMKGKYIAMSVLPKLPLFRSDRAGNRVVAEALRNYMTM